MPTWDEANLQRIMRDNPDLAAVNQPAKVHDDVKSKPVSPEVIPPGGPVRQAMVDPDPPFRSKTEAAAWAYFQMTYKPVACFYEAVILKLPGGNYTPDFCALVRNDESGVVEQWFIEVKGRGGFQALGSGRSSLRVLREVALHPRHRWRGRFFALVKQKDGWKIKEFGR